MRRWGIRGRVVAASVGTLAVALAGLTAGANLLLADQLDRDANNVLRDRAAAELATLGTSHGRLVVHEGTRDQALDRSWVFVGSRAVERGPGSAPVQRAATSLAGARGKTVRNGPDDVRLHAEPVLDDQRHRLGTVVVGLSLVPYEDTEHIGLLASLILSVCVLAAGGIVAWRAVGAALRPVADMTVRAADWSEHDLHRRFDLGPARDELTGLAATLDGLLARIDGALRHEKRFSAEVAHELRTPLTGVRAEAELTLRSASGEQSAALKRIVAITERMDGVIESLLTIGRQEVDPGVASADPVEVARGTVEACRPAAKARGVALALESVTPTRAGAPSNVIARALHPLVDNAVRHARTTVQVAVVPNHTDVVVRVQDDGDGVPATDIDAIFDPGVRAAGPNGGGAGLGLPLARRLARSCGGEVEAEPGPGGRFLLRLPSVGG